MRLDWREAEPEFALGELPFEPWGEEKKQVLRLAFLAPPAGLEPATS